MAINSISSSYNVAAATQPQKAPVQVQEKENDGDADDGGSVAATSATQGSTVNSSGQAVGSIINEKA